MVVGHITEKIRKKESIVVRINPETGQSTRVPISKRN